MDAQMLFREGVLALRDKHDAAQARQLLTQSLKIDPRNEMAWLWLSRTTDDPQQKLQCVDRALQINPDNPQALALRDKLRPTRSARKAAAQAAAQAALLKQQNAAQDDAERTITGLPAAPAQPEETVESLLAGAERRLKAGDTEGAIEQWVRILEFQPDQPVAIQKAVQYLYKLGYKDDARELIERAIHEGTTSIPIYLTAIDLARASGEPAKADNLREQVAALPNADDDLIVKIIDHFVENAQVMRAQEVLDKALFNHPESAALLMRMGKFQEQSLGDKAQAQVYYESAARGGKGKASKVAEKALSNYTPVITDRERGSVTLALREAAGFGVIFVLLGWQDAGLDLMKLGPQRWLGVGLSLIGGYLLVTALSSPQQKPLAAWLGGKVPAPEPAAAKPAAKYEEPDAKSDSAVNLPTGLPIMPGVMRALFALVGIIVLVGAFLLVFNVSVGLLRSPVPPSIPSIYDLVSP